MSQSERYAFQRLAEHNQALAAASAVAWLLDRAREYCAARHELDSDWPSYPDGLRSIEGSTLTLSRYEPQTGSDDVYELDVAELAGDDYLERIPETLRKLEAERAREIHEKFAVARAIGEAKP